MKVGNKKLKECYLCCVTLGKSFYLVDYHFSHLKSWDDSKSSINYLAIFCVFIPFLLEIRSQTRKHQWKSKQLLCVGYTQADHILPATPVCCWFLCISPHQNVAMPACLWIIIGCLRSLQTEQLKQENLTHLLSGPSQREFNRPRFGPKRTRINFDPYFNISLLLSPLAPSSVFSAFEEEKKQAEEAVACEHLGFPCEGRAQGLRWKDQAAHHKLLGQQNCGLYDLFISPFGSLVPTCRYWQLQP